MSQKKVLMIVEVTAVWEKMEEFNKRWELENLPYWQQNGANYIGSYTTYVGADTNKTLRIFEFENITLYQKFMEDRFGMFETRTGKSSVNTVHQYVERIKETIWLSTGEIKNTRGSG